jgi:membrane-associated HD superfamily phosphohydrolase
MKPNNILVKEQYLQFNGHPVEAMAFVNDVRNTHKEAGWDMNKTFNDFVFKIKKELQRNKFLDEDFNETYFYNHLKKTGELLEFKEYVIEYNVRSRCGKKAYSAVILDVKSEFSQDTFDDMLSYQTHTLQSDGSHYYLEQDLEGRRADGGQNVFYDRAWVRSPREGKEFLRYLEQNL